MAALREIRDRIDSVRNTMKITNAMYMISSTKLNTARKKLKSTEPYFYTLQSMFERILRHLPSGFSHPYLDRRTEIPEGERSRAFLCITADKGLAGAYNANVLKLAESRMGNGKRDHLYVVGEVGRQYFLHRNVDLDGEFHYTAQKPTLSRARHISMEMLALFREKKVDEVYVVYTRMKNQAEFVPELIQLLPLVHLDSDLMNAGKMPANTIQETFSLEPTPTKLLNNIVPEFVNGYIYSALVESYCAEHFARMQAMDAANRNGNQLIRDLTIEYNRSRQARITQEITEVAAGARARREQLERARKTRKDLEP